MKLSELAAKIDLLRAEHGDLDALDDECFPLINVEVRQATDGELKYWGMDPKVPYIFAQIGSDK